MITTTMTPDEVLAQMLADREEIKRECVQYMAKGNCKEVRTAKTCSISPQVSKPQRSSTPSAERCYAR